MPRIDEETKSRRKERVWLEVRQHNGIRQIEIAEQLQFENRTVYNYLQELGDEGKVFKEGRLWYALPYQETRLRRFALSPEEAMTIYLATRLYVKQQDKRHEAAESALYRLAEVLTSDAQVGKEIRQAANELARRDTDLQYSRVFREIIRGYIYRRRLRVKYAPSKGDPFETLFDVYLLEPSAIGYSTYMIGHSEIVHDVRSFKIERVLSAKLTNEMYEVPSDFPGLDILRSAWSIISGDRTQRIVLRFSQKVRRRVLETKWHPSQAWEDDPDKPGYLRWWVDVADTTDMKPWIRGWGADVEVLEPEVLRDELTKTTVALNKLYDIPLTGKLAYQLPYAKTNPDNREEIHLLIYHLIDVGQVTLALWKEVLTMSIKHHLAEMLGLNIEQTGRFLAFLASLHDLGKVGPAYQRKYAPDWLKKELQNAGLVLQDPINYSQKTQDPRTSHATVTAWALQDLLSEMLNLHRRFAQKIASALGGHHGEWPPAGATDHLDDSHYPAWNQVRRDLVWELKAVFSPPQAVESPANGKALNTFLTLFSGLVSVADWLGSRNQECFGFVEQPMSTRQYAARSAKRAKASLQDLGWIGWQPVGKTLSFAEAFSYLNFEKPRRIQEEVLTAASDAEPPVLLILEAPTAIGKTETAAYLADTWLQKYQGRGLYVAMPTQATSNQMYERIGDFLNHRYPEMPINYHLVHGQAAWLDDLKQKVTLQTVGDDQATGVLAESWFTPRKRTLLAPFGVGTVDQTLLSILQTRHFFVRLFGLSHKVVIFDEVHAYDTYMDTLFYRLLEWLSAIGTSVIILSATLPAKVRESLVEAYAGKALPATAVSYPLLTLAQPDSEPRTLSLSKPKDVTLQLNWEVSRDPASILSYLQDTLAEGGCAAVICNTVGRAQDVYRALNQARKKNALDLDAENLILFHARFPPVWRQEIESKVLQKFSKDSDRPHKAIVVATQVIEQSLDLDFDVMITDLAPIDLLIQRAGRLHRHDRGTRAHQRQLAITQAELEENGLPNFGNDQYVYEPFVLLRSYLVLHRKTNVTLPQETTNLIEAVYGRTHENDGLSPEWQDALKQAQRRLENNQREAQSKAKGHLVYEPENRRLLWQSNLGLEEGNPDVHQMLRAQTRDIDPGISLVCLQADGDNMSLISKDGPVTFELAAKPSPLLTRQLLQNVISVQRRALVNYFLDEAQMPPASWRQNSALRHCRPVIFINQEYDLAGTPYRLRLTPTFGLEILKKEAV